MLSADKKEKMIINSKRLYRVLEVSSIFVGVIMALYYFYPVFASPPATMYAPGETTDPNCLPGSTNCSVYPPLTTTLTTSTAITMGLSTLKFAYDASNYSTLSVGSDGALNISSTNSATTTFANKISFLSNAYFTTIASGTWNGNTIGIAYGGTNSSSIGAAGSVAYSDGSSYNFTATSSAGLFLQSNGIGAPTWAVASGLYSGWLLATSSADAGFSIANAGQAIFSGANAVTTTRVNNTITFGLINSGITAGTYGSASAVPVFTVNAQGLITANSTSTIAIPTSSITSGVFGIAYGGTNSSSIGPAGSLAYSDANSYVFTAAGLVGQILQSNGTGAPTWINTSTAGYVNLQSTTSGTLQTGNFNISGTGLVGTAFGVNTTSPIASLSVQGIGGTNPFVIASSTGVSLLTILQNGNVGIGTDTPTSSLDVVVNSVGGANTAGFKLYNTTAGTAGLSQNSPMLTLGSNGWGTTASTSQAFEWGVQNIMNPGVIPSSVLTFFSKRGAAAYSSAMTLTRDSFDNVTLGVANAVQAPTGQFTTMDTYTSQITQITLGGSNATGVKIGKTGAINSLFGTVGINTTSAANSITILGLSGKNPFEILSSTLSSMFAIHQDGRVGINTSTPQTQLSIVGTAGSDIFDVASSTGTSILRITSNGNIGIGTTTPSSALSVVGDVNITGDYYIAGANYSQFFIDTAGATGQLWQSDGSGRGTWTNTSSLGLASGTFVNLQSATIGSQQTGHLNISGTGIFGLSVGIGTSTVSSTLTVQGVAGANIFDVVSSTGVSLFRILANGNVGIGTTTPNAKLTVVGSGNTSTTLTFNTFSNSGTSTFKIDDAGNTSFTNDGLYYEASSSVSYINSMETGAVSFDMDAGVITWIDMAVSSTALGTPMSYTATIGGNPVLTVYGESDGLGGITATSTMLGIGTTTPQYFVDIIAADVRQNIFRAGNTSTLSAFVINSSGFVGINSSSPIASLAIKGTAGSNPFVIASSSGDSLLTITQGGSILAADGTSALPSYSFANDTDKGFYSVSSEMFYVNNTPRIDFTQTDMRFISSYTFGWTAAAAGDAMDVGFSRLGAGKLALGNGTNANASGTLILSKIGINTTTPAAKLEIWGTGITSSTQSLGIYNASSTLTFGVLDDGSAIINGGAVYHDGTAQVTYVNSLETGNFSFPDDGGIMSWTNLNASSSAVDTVQSYTASVGDIPILTVYGESDGASGIKATSTMLGIGTTTPHYFVDIIAADARQNIFSIGNTSTANVFVINSAGNIGINSTTPSASFALKGTSGTNPFVIASSTGASILTVLQNGYVGISSSSPAYTLDVRGNSYVRAPIHAGVGDQGWYFNVAEAGNYFFSFDNAYNDAGSLIAKFTSGSAIQANGGNTNFYTFTGATIGNTVSLGGVKFSLLASGGLNLGYTTTDPGAGNFIVSGKIGVGTSSPAAKLEIWGTGNTSSTRSLNTFSNGGTSTFKIDDAGNASFTNDGLYYEASSSVSYINSFETGGLNFDDNAGMVSWVDMDVSSTVAGDANSYTASIGGNPMIQVYGESNGTGGMQNMTVSIGTSTTSTYKLYIDAGVSTTAGLGVNGFVKATGYITGSTTLDIAETYPVDPECGPGSPAGECPLVGDVICSNEDASSTFYISRCSATSTDSIIGVVSGNPGFILGGYEVNNVKIKGLYPTSYRPVALGGRVPVNVSNANGAIKAGDYLTSSGVPGVAVKALDPGKAIGMALQSFPVILGGAVADEGSLSVTGTILVFVNTSWSPGSPVIPTAVEESLLPDFTKVVLDKFTLVIKNSLRKLGLLLKDGIATVKEVFATKITTQQLCVGATCINEAQLQDLLNKTNTQSAPTTIIESPVVTTTPTVIPTPVEESLTPTSTPDSITTTTPIVVIPVETGIQSSSTLDVTIPAEPVIVIIDTTTP